MAWLAAGLVLVTFAVHAVLAVQSGYYVSHVSGVWLGLARDFADGVLYRPLVSEAGYGGTRYAPLMFVTIGSLMQLGAPPLAAGFTVEAAAVVALVAGVAVLLARNGLATWQVAALAALAIAPYFVHETLFEIRPDVLAASLQIWGLLLVLGRDTGRDDRTLAVTAAALLFTLAWAAKITSVAGAAAAVLWLGLTGRRAVMVRLTALTLAGMATISLLVHVASAGRALESFRAVALADTDVQQTFLSMLRRGPAVLVGGSLVLKALLLPVAAALVVDRRAWRTLPALFVVCSAVTTMFVLSSPGAVLRNHIVELWVAAVIFTGVFLHTRPKIAPAGYVFVAGLLTVSAWHVARDLRQADLIGAVDRLQTERRGVLAEVEHFNVPVLSESAVLPVLAGERPYLLDPFALRVAMQSNATVAADLDGKLDRRFFKYIVFQYDPETARGMAAYTGLHFGRPAIERMLANYQFKTSVGPYRIYVPRD